MAKESFSISFNNACIDSQNMIITETTKEDFAEYNLQEVLNKWHGIEGVSLSIKRNTDIKTIDDGGDDE